MLITIYITRVRMSKCGFMYKKVQQSKVTRESAESVQSNCIIRTLQLKSITIINALNKVYTDRNEQEMQVEHTTHRPIIQFYLPVAQRKYIITLHKLVYPGLGPDLLLLLLNSPVSNAPLARFLIAYRLIRSSQLTEASRCQAQEGVVEGQGVKGVLR